MIHAPQSVGSELAIFRSSEQAQGGGRSCVNAHFTVSCVGGGPETVQKHVCISDTLAGVSGSTDHNSAVELSYQETVALGSVLRLHPALPIPSSGFSSLSAA